MGALRGEISGDGSMVRESIADSLIDSRAGKDRHQERSEKGRIVDRERESIVRGVVGREYRGAELLSEREQGRIVDRE